MALADRVNPILLRHLRQATRGRELFLIYIILLLGGVIVSLVAPDAPRPAYAITTAIWVALTAICLFILPVMLSQAAVAEHTNQVHEMIVLTRLTPWQIVMGKFWAMLLLGVVCVAALAPFLATAYLLGGVNFYFTLLCMGGPLLAGAVMNALTLGLVAGVERKAAQRIGQFFVLVLGLLGGGYGIALNQVLQWYGVAWGDVELLLLINGALVIPVTLTALLIARSRYLPAQANRVGAVRCACLVTLIAMLASLVAAAESKSLSPYDAYGVAEVTLFLGIVAVAVLAIFTVTTDPVPSRRVLRAYTRSRVRRLGGILFGPGAARAILYVIACYGVLFLAVWLELEHYNSSSYIDPENALFTTLTALGYVTFFTGVPLLALRLLARNPSPLQGRLTILASIVVATALGSVIHVLLPVDTAAYRGYGRPYSAALALNPFVTIDAVHYGREFAYHPVVALMGVIGAIAWAILAIRSLRAERAIAAELRREADVPPA